MTGSCLDPGLSHFSQVRIDVSRLMLSRIAVSPSGL